MFTNISIYMGMAPAPFCRAPCKRRKVAIKCRNKKTYWSKKTNVVRYKAQEQ
jgi:hypothetical protein